MEQSKGATTPLGHYFADDGSGSSFFDHLRNTSGESAMMTSVVASTSTQELFDSTIGSISLLPDEPKPPQSDVDSSSEPTICKIFSKNEGVSSSGSFFDMISSVAGDESNASHSGGSFLEHTEGPFPSSLLGFEDMLDVTQSSEADRSREAWIPSESTRRALILVATSTPGAYIPDNDLLTMPGIIQDEELLDNVTQLMKHLFGEAEASTRQILTANDVPQDEGGLRKLIDAECFRAAVNLTGRLLAIYGQGPNRQGHVSKHTVHSIQLWFTRLSLLVKLGYYQNAEAESSVWWDFDKPDLYYQFYPGLYGGKPGTMVPFNMRLLVAIIPAYVKRCSEALQRLYSILSVVRQILRNLDSGKSEDGSLLELNQREREISKKVWRSREARVSHSIVNVAMMTKDFPMAIELIQELIKKNQSSNQKRALESALGRIFIQLGDLKSAENCFNNCKQLKKSQPGTLNANTPDVRELVDRGLLMLARSSFQEAYECFQKANLLESSNVTVINNMAVCLLYMGQLKNALNVLEAAIQKNPAIALHEALLLNVCTLYELESSKVDQNKQALLKLVAKYRGDAINVGCLKLHSK